VNQDTVDSRSQGFFVRGVVQGSWRRYDGAISRENNSQARKEEELSYSRERPRMRIKKEPIL
jgi:hypothetical protein